jgi:hypothetical protein
MDGYGGDALPSIEWNFVRSGGASTALFTTADQ